MSHSSRLAGLTKQPAVITAGILFGGTIVGGAAQADTLLIQTFELNEKTATNGSFEIDLNGDGFNDFRVNVKEDNPSFKQKGFASISGINQSKQKVFNTALQIADGPTNGDAPYTSDPRAIGRVLVESVPIMAEPLALDIPDEGFETEMVDLRRVSSFVQKLDNGDNVDASSGPFLSKGVLYDDNGLGFGLRPDIMVFNDELIGDVEPSVEFPVIEIRDPFGPFSNEGDRGFIGLSLTFGEDDLWLADNIANVRVVEEGDLLVHQGDTYETIGPVTHYGWIEVVRGSVTAIRTGFQQVAGQSAPIPALVAVSEPATLPLIALGAAGLVALRRRKKAA